MTKEHTNIRPSIVMLDLQTRTYRLLMDAGMRYIDQVEHISDAELDQIPRFGKVTRADLRARIEAYQQEKREASSQPNPGSLLQKPIRFSGE